VGSDLPLKVLFVVPYAPTRIRTRPYHLIKNLALAGHQITLATLWSNGEERTELRQLAQTLDGLIAEKLPRVRSAFNCLWSLASDQPAQAVHSWSPRLAKRLGHALNSGSFDVIHVEHLRGARYGLWLRSLMARHALKNIPLIWDSVDCISGLFRLTARQSYAASPRFAARFELPKTKRFEGCLTACFNRVLATSEKDCSELLELADLWLKRHQNASRPHSDPSVTVLPNGVDIHYFVPAQKPRRPLTLVISGKMSYHANVTAVIRFVKEVMPLIWARNPDICLWVVGQNPPPAIRRLGVPWNAHGGNGVSSLRPESRVRITGTVEDIRPFMWEATVAVAPIQYGAGIQNKILEAFACGTPVVATSKAVEALRVVSGRHLVVADGRQAMADAILSLLNNPGLCSRLSGDARILVEQQYDWRSTAQYLSQIYRQAMSTTAEPSGSAPTL
jgi:polysaccharide biosynthesis protein PslH